MVGDKWLAIEEFHHDSCKELWIEKNEVLIETAGYDGKDLPDGYNVIVKQSNEKEICDVGSDFAKKYLRKIEV